jgi:tetratricopeptide (TPR) repeat protein
MASDRDDSAFRYRKEKTEISNRRLSVRMASGKVYGPYRRAEVLSFIAARRIRGEEEILFEGEVDWQPIASDPEFFDALHSLLEGKRPSSRSEVDQEESSGRGTAVRTEMEGNISLAKTEISDSGAPLEEEPDDATRNTAVTQTKSAVVEKPTAPAARSGRSERSRKSAGAWIPNHAVKPISAPLPSPRVAAREKRKKQAKGIFPIVIAGLLAFAYVWTHDTLVGKGSGTKSTPLVPMHYFKALNDSLKLWKNREIPSMPANLDFSGPAVRVGGNAEAWAQSLQSALAAQVPADLRNSKSYWRQLAWDLAAMGAVMQIQSVPESKRLLDQSAAILSELKRRNALSGEDRTLFDAQEAFRVSDLEQASRLAETLPDDAARWIFENCSWILHWEKNQKKPYFGSARAFSESRISLESHVRRAFAMRDAQIGQAMEMLADENPFSEALWFASGEVLWRGQGGAGVSAAGQSFVAGLEVLSLAPPALQVNYWREYIEFLKAFGRKSSITSATSNYEMLASGNLATSRNAKKWWDLGSEGLDPQVYAEGLLKKAREGDLGPSELAALKVFGRLLPEGNEMLAVVARDLMLRGKFDVAEKVIDQMLSRNASDSEALGLRVWLDSENYRFFDAMGALEKDLKGAPLVAQRYRLPLLVIGREYEEAETLIATILQSRPQDAWPHFWRAKIKKARSEPKACMASASIAKLQSRGSMSRSSEILFYECQVLAKSALERGIKELEQLFTLRPSETRYLPLIADAYLALDQPQNGLNYLEKATEVYSSNADLLLSLGKIYERMHETEKAKGAYQNVAIRVPGDARGLLELARMLENAGKTMEAARTYQAAALVNPRMPEIFLKAARSMEKAGLIQEAATLYGREIELRPAVLSTFVEAATFLLKNNNPKLVPELYRKFAGGGFEQDPRALLRLAQAYFAMEDFENARISAATALSVDPKNPEIYLILAQSLEKLGEFQTARSYYQRYLGLNPGAADAAEIQDRISRPPFSAD